MEDSPIMGYLGIAITVIMFCVLVIPWALIPLGIFAGLALLGLISDTKDEKSNDKGN